MAFAHYEAHTPAEENARHAGSDRNLTLLLLLLVAVLFGWYRYNDMRLNQASDTSSVVATPAPVTEETPSASVRRDTPATSKSERHSTVARATLRSSAPEPIAGNPLPEYPAVALRHGESGRVVLQIRIDENGLPIDVDVARRSGSRELDRAAIQAVREWRFKPALQNGKPVSSVVELPVDFKPQG
jgi:TonB family protein